MTRMSRADRQRWGSARTLAEVGELTALWLEGRIASQPGYAPGCSPAEETRPLIGVLAACNRAGFLTDASQPGYCGQGWEQRAAVEGFAAPDMAERLRLAVGAASLAGLCILIQPASRWFTHATRAVPVTCCQGRPFTRFGVQLSRRYISDPHTGYGICHPAAVRALCAARRVTIIDLAWGRDDLLWTVLASFTAAVRKAG